MTDDDIRLFNELMSTQPGEQIEGLASRYPDVFEKPRVNEIPDPLNMKGRIADSERKRKEQEEAEFQAKYGQKTILDMARPEFIPDDITAAIKAIGTLGSGAGAGIKGMIGEAFGMDPEATVQRNIYFPDVLEKAKSGQKLTPDEERELAFYGRYIDKGSQALETAGDLLEPLGQAYDASKLDALMFMPGTRNISMIDDIIDMGIRGARDVAPIVRPAIKSATKAATQVGTKAIETVQETLATPPVGAISLDTLGFSSRLSEGVDKLQDKGTGPQFLAQLSKMKGVPLAEIKVTGLDEYLKNTPKVTKQEVQDYLETNRLQLIEDERIAGAGRLTERDLNALPSEFDWLDRYDLDEDFEDKAHLRNHLMVTLNRHFDDLEADAADTGGFYAKDSSGEVRYIPESRKLEWLESEQDRIDDILSEFPDFNSATNFSNDYLIPGGQNYREILYKLPDDKVEGVFSPPASHYTDAMNTFGTIRSTDRTIDGTPTLFAEEIQSDWAIAGAKRGYAIDKKAELPEGTRIFAPGEANIPGESWSSFTVRIPNSVHGRNLFYGTTREEAIANAQSFIAQPTRNPVPDNPFRGNWYKPVINNFLVKAAQEGKGGIGFPVGEIVKDRYNLANVVDRIESYTDDYTVELYTPAPGGPFKYVTIDLKPALDDANKKQMRLTVDKDGLVWETNAGQYNRFIGKPLTEVVGKGVSEKILSNDSQVMTDLDLKIGGEGKDKLYDDMLPKHLNEIGKRYGVQLEKRTIPFGEGKKKESEVYFMPITEEMRNDILSQGLPMFKQGGHVQKFAPGGKVLKGISEGVKAAKNISKKDLQTIGSELETSRGLLPDVAKKYPQIRDASVAGIESITKGDPFTAYRGISLLPGRDLESEIMPSTTLSPGVALNILRDAPVMIRNNEFISPTSVLRQYPNIKPTDVEVFVPSMIEQIRERQPGALEMKIPTRSGGKMLINDIFDEVLREKEVLTDVTGKTLTDIKFDRHGGGFMDQLLMGVARDVFSGNWKGGENYLKEIGGYYTNPDEMIQEFDAFATSIAPTRKAKGGPIKSALEGVGKAAAEVKKAGKLTRLQKELRERGGEKQAQRLERAADEIPGLERLFHSRGLIEAFQGSEGFPYQGVVTMRPGDYKNFSQPLEVDLSEGRQGISPYSVQNIEDLRDLIRRGRPFTSVPYLQLDKKGPLTIVSGHEGRHRTRAMEAEDIPATLVQVLPRHSLKFKDLRNPSPSEWRQKLSEAMGPEGLVLPEGGMKLNPKFARASELAKKASEERDWNKFGALDRELSRYHKEDKVKLPDLEMLTEFPEVYQKGGAVKSIVSGAQRAAKEGQKMLQGVYRGYTGERLEEPVLSTTPQRKVAEYYATRRAATRGEDPHIEMLMVDPFVGKEYGLALPIDEFNRELLTTRARAIAPSDVVERTQLKKKGGLACLSK
jgi:hypothetical protein